MDDLHPIEVEDENIIKEAVNAELKRLESESAPTREAWHQISRRLSKHEAAEKSRRYRTGWLRSLNIAAVVMLFIGAGIWATSIIKDYRHDLAEGEFSSTHKYLGSHPEAADEESDVSIMADDEGANFAPESAPDSVPAKDAGSPGATMEDSRRSFPPRVLGRFRLKGAPRTEGSLTRYLYVDGDRELSFLEGDSDMLSDAVPIYARNDGEFIPPESLNDLHGAPFILLRDSMGKPVLAWTEGDKTFILWPNSDNITEEELRKLHRKMPRPDSQEDNP